jgi:lipopolysaccharide/colanic/teichoic acid biosynthesis glycosyltransferase
MTLHIPNLASDSRTDTSSRTLHAPADAGLYRKFFKRALDLTLVLLSAPIVLPLIVFLAVLVALLTGGRPFYSQLRVGRHGTPFRMWKLRTMVVNADAQLEHYLQQNPAARAEWDSTQKLKNDPRITAVGRLLRKTSIDELPQLFNVLNGTMSLVGPRPMMVGQEKYYHGSAYYEMRPGITGLWQVSDRNDCDFADRVAFDTKYNSDLSLKTDLGLLLRTVGVVMRATGH